MEFGFAIVKDQFVKYTIIFIALVQKDFEVPPCITID